MDINRTILLLTRTLLMKAAIILSCASVIMAQNLTIAELAKNTESLSTLFQLAGNYPDIVELLSDRSKSLTVFAPTNDAFHAAGINASDVELVEAVLTYHVLPVSARAADLKPLDFADTLLTDAKFVNLTSGKAQVLGIQKKDNLVSFLDGSIPAANPKVVQADVAAANGVVHVIDKVLTVPTKAGKALELAGLTTLRQLLIDNNLVETVQGLKGITVFAPTNEAFSKASSVLAKLTSEQVKQVLKYHVGLAAAYSTNLPGSVKTAEGNDLKITQQNGIVKVNDATVKQTNVLIANGVVHVIDEVLIPPALRNIAAGNGSTTSSSAAKSTASVFALFAAGLLSMLV